MVADDDHGTVYGYMLYELLLGSILLLRLGVHPRYRREGVGSIMIHELKSKLHTPSNREMVTAYVPDCNLPAHLFFNSCGLMATNIEFGFHQDQDYYRFEYSLKVRAR
jgi:GNAT superfamily N-acetyltransferase